MIAHATGMNHLKVKAVALFPYGLLPFPASQAAVFDTANMLHYELSATLFSSARRSQVQT
jgi:hypothetical protein